MPKKLSDEVAQEALDLLAKYGTCHKAGEATGIPHNTIRVRVKAAERRGLVPDPDVVPDDDRKIAALEYKVKSLQAQLKQIEFEELGAEEIRQKIFKVAKLEPDPPGWLVEPPSKMGCSPGVPILFCSDWHWGEMVDKNQIAGVDNAYNLKIARERVRSLVNGSIDLLFNHMVNPEYPGIVLAFGGDNFCGDIHEELSETSEATIMQSMVDLLGVLIWVVNQLLDRFPNIFITGVVGNHGRTSRKPRHKGRTHTNFDWLLYQLLKRHYHPYDGKANKRISFLIPDGPDALFRVYNHRYLLTHGDQFRGGDGITGALMPIMRGDHKKRSRNSQIDQDYDTLMIGHWHTLWQSRRLVVNGSLKGYDEFAYNLNLPYESPMQALWITHPERGITFSVPVHVEPKKKQTKSEWVSVSK